jgi:hypothetical protein
MAIWKADQWNFRIFDRREILVKSKQKGNRRIYAEDTLTKKSLILELVEDVPENSVELGKMYTARIKVYTSKSAEGVDTNFVELFQVLDVDRPIEDFLEAACRYPDFVRFELVEIED